MGWVEENIKYLTNIMEATIESDDSYLITNYPYKILKFEFMDDSNNILLSATESMLENINKQYEKFNIKTILEKYLQDYIY